MRIGLVRIMQRSNTFARQPGWLRREDGARWYVGEALSTLFAHTATALGGALAACHDLGIAAVPLLAVDGEAGGPVPDTDLRDTLAALEQAVRTAQPLDGIFIELSGALTTQEGTHGDQAILQALRSWLGPEPVIGVLFDHAANLSFELPSVVDIVVGPGTAPATDKAERARQLIVALATIGKSKRRPALAMRRIPLLLPLSWQWTGYPPLQRLLQEVRESEDLEQCALTSLFFGFPQADVPWAGATVFTSDARGPAAAHERAAAFAEKLWHTRNDLAQTQWNIEEAVHTAMADPTTPFCLAELGDVPEAGGPAEGTAALWAMLDLGVHEGLLVAIADAEALAQAQRVGVGGAFNGAIGGKRDTRGGYPIDVQGEVRALAPGRFRRERGDGAGLDDDAGGIAFLDLAARHGGHVQVILTERPVVPDPGLFTAIGIDPIPNLLVVKSALAFRAAWPHRLALPVATPGITTPEFTFYRFTRLPRPLWPLDPL